MLGQGTYAVVDALNAEWVELSEQSGAVVRRWSRQHLVLAHCECLDDVLSSLRREPDPVLRVLLAEAGAGCRTAARTVLQTLLGKLVKMAQRSAYSGVDDFVSAAWCRIMCYPLARRPERIAANLVLDTLKDVSRPSSLREVEDPVPWPPGDHLEELLARRHDRVGATAACSGEGDAPSERGLIGAAVDLQVIPPEFAEVLVSVYVDGLTSLHAARRHAVSAEVVRYRCSQATRRMRGQALQLLEAA